MRTNTILNYFKFLRSQSDQSRNEEQGFIRHSDLTKRLVADRRVQPEVKQAVALSSCMAFLNGYGNDRDTPLLELAATYFWDGIDVSAGEIPREDSLQGYVYRHSFHYRPSGHPIVGLPVRDKLSQELFNRIRRMKKFEDLPWDNVRLMMYSYASHTPRDTDSPFVAFLSPSESLEFHKMVIGWANTSERQLNVGREMNSLSGSVMFRNLERSPEAQRLWAEATLQFYEAHYSKEWYPAKVMYEVAVKFPDLAGRIKKRAKDWRIPAPE